MRWMCLFLFLPIACSKPVAGVGTDTGAGTTADAECQFVPDGVSESSPGQCCCDVMGEHVSAVCVAGDWKCPFVDAGRKYGTDLCNPCVTACPDTTMAVDVSVGVLPQTVMHLTCDTQNGDFVAKCVWKVTQPPGSVAKVTVGPTPNDATFTPEIGGAYTFCPVASYANGVKGCAIPCRTINVVPDQNLHVELSWETPGAATATADDPCQQGHPRLHFAHEKASEPDQDCDGEPDPWFDPKYDDSGWQTKGLDWGAPGDVNDPSFDALSPGVEGLNLSYLEPGVDYAVGVHNEGSCGPSTATVRVYQYGALAYQSSLVLKPLDMWFVGQIKSDETGLTPCNHGDTCQNGGNSGPCITPCYAPPMSLGLPGIWTSTVCP